MMKRYTWCFLLLSTLFLAACETAPNELMDKSKAKENILFIGNSYTYRNGGVDYHLYNLTRGVKDVQITYISRAAQGKYHLYTHWEDATTLSKLTSRKWDKVILQEYSSGPVRDTKDFIKFGEKWKSRLNFLNPKTQIYLFSTWGYKDAPKMTDSLYTKYNELGTIIGASIVPVGMMWKNLKNKINLYDGDGAHPNRKGTFITACLFYEHIFGKDVRKTPHNDKMLSIGMQVKLKNWAHEYHAKYHRTN